SADRITLDELAGIVRSFIPTAEISFEQPPSISGSVAPVGDGRIEAEFGVTRPPLAQRVLETINTTPSAAGLPASAAEDLIRAGRSLRRGRHMNEQPLLYEAREGIAWITLNRPEALNAMNRALGEGLAKAWTEFAADPEARVAVVSGAGGRAFSAG